MLTPTRGCWWISLERQTGTWEGVYMYICACRQWLCARLGPEAGQPHAADRPWLDGRSHAGLIQLSEVAPVAPPGGELDSAGSAGPRGRAETSACAGQRTRRAHLTAPDWAMPPDRPESFTQEARCWAWCRRWASAWLKVASSSNLRSCVQLEIQTRTLALGHAGKNRGAL